MTMKTTRCARLAAVGAPVTIEDVALPDPAEGEVEVALDRAGLNPLDIHAMEGRVGDVERLPRTLGVEGTGLRDGRRVVVSGAGIGLVRDGTFGGAVIVPAANAVEIPDGVPADVAAVIAIAGVTAWRVTRELARVDPLDRVLVLGAAGGVGSLVTQLARSAGAVVWAQTGSAGKREFLAGLGADEVVVTDAAGLPDAVRALAPTVVFDPLGGAFTPAGLAALQPYGRLVSYGAAAGVAATIEVRSFYRNGLRMLGYGGILESASRTVEGVTNVAAEVAAGRLAIPVAEVIQLERIADAVEAVRARKVTGKIVLDVAG
jgi:NADPH2:quinone reductase